MPSTTISAAIDLPWPAKALHPNSRPHHMAKHRATKAAREAARIMAKPIGKIDAEAVKVTCIFSPPPPKRNRDADNLLASCKAYFDGIADAIGIDDSRFRHQAPEWGEPVKGGNVCVVLEAVDTWEHVSGPVGRVIASIPKPVRGAA
jgi:crossover junction endodeoxyribonuclease RusA